MPSLQPQNEMSAAPLYIETLVNVPLPQSFTYSCPPELAEQVAVGKRVEVRFGNRRMTAFVMTLHQAVPENLSVPIEKIKPILKVLDQEPIFTQEHIQLAAWMAGFYLCTQGEALATMIPSGRRETEGPHLSFSDGGLEFQPRDLSQQQQQAVEAICQSTE